MHSSATSLPAGIPRLHLPSPITPSRKNPTERAYRERLHNTISDLIGLITISPVCAEHTLPLAPHSTPKPAVPPDRRNRPSQVSSQPTPLRITAHSAFSTPTALNRVPNIFESKSQSLVPRASCAPFSISYNSSHSRLETVI